jgi:hypothetical protein
MQLHTHCLVLNRAETTEDGKWRALDGRALLAARSGAGALYNRTLEAELTRRLGVGWRERPDGLRELAGVDDELIEAFSSRRRAITTRVADMADAYRDKYGIDPPPAVLSAMAGHATLATRPRKHDITPAAALDAWEATARAHGRRLADLPRHVLGQGVSTLAPAAPLPTLVPSVLERLAASGRATFTRHDVLRAALDVLDPAGRSPETLRDLGQRLQELVLPSPELILATATDPVDAPMELRRADGTSVYEQPHRERWTLRPTLHQERWLLDVAGEPTERAVRGEAVHTAIAVHGLGEDQAQAVQELLGADRRVGMLVGPAGAGKTRTLRAVVDAWQQTGSEVLGLTVSQSAAEVLAAEAEVRTENTAKWLHESRLGRWHVPTGALVIIDEASMIATTDLVDIVDQVRRASGRVLLVGDPAQLAAIHIGGAFDLLVDRHGAARLHEVRRFTHQWERDASQLLRQRDPAALAEYAMRGRIHGGSTEKIEAALFDAWRDAALADRDDDRPSALMIVATNEQAAVLSERARHALLESGVVKAGPTVELRDNIASVGDHVVTRRNDRNLRTSTGGWVVNGDVWTVEAVHRNGTVDVCRHGDGATARLPATYLAAHTHLAYATTAHRAQGMTVDVCHAAITPDATHEQLYVASTRGRHANHLWVMQDADQDIVRNPEDLPSAEEVLSQVLNRRDPDRLAAHQVIEDSQREMGSLARLGQIFEDAARAATETWLTDTLQLHGLGSAKDDREWPSLVSRIREAALAGHDVQALLEHAVAARNLDDVHSVAGVLHWRIGSMTSTSHAARAPGPLASLPPVAGPEFAVARQVGKLIRQRWREIRVDLTASTELPAAIDELGVRPADPGDASAWLAAATAMMAYRERFEVPSYKRGIGPRPSENRPDARAAWDHARHQSDLYQSRRLRDLTDDELQELDVRMAGIAAQANAFNPESVEAVWKQLDSTKGICAGSTSWAIQELESELKAHREARDMAAMAAAVQHRIRLTRRR